MPKAKTKARYPGEYRPAGAYAVVDWSKTGDRLRATWYVKKYSKPGKVKKQRFVTGPWDAPEDMPETLLESISIHRRLERVTTDDKVKFESAKHRRLVAVRYQADIEQGGEVTAITMMRAMGGPMYPGWTVYFPQTKATFHRAIDGAGYDQGWSGRSFGLST